MQANDLNPEVFIAGAGPTGLTLALVLASAGVRVTICDKNARRSAYSKALAIQAGPLELFGSRFPALSAAFVQAGRPAHEAFMQFDDAAPVRIDFSSIPSAYPYILIIEQSETERILEEALVKAGVRVWRETEVTAVAQQGEEVMVATRTPSGTFEHRAQYVIGCDGAHSTVRHASAIPFQGGSYEGTFLLADVKIKWPWPYDSIRTFVNARGTLACFPFKEPQRYRMILAPRGPARQGELTLGEVAETARAIGSPDIAVREAVWLNRFRTHHRVAARLRNGRAFLAGDAAHIHSPVGGQGMNTGITDAFNLGTKLARVLRDGAPPSLLDAYERERLPVIRQLIRNTDFFTRAGLTQENALLNMARRLLAPRVVAMAFVQRPVVRHVSQVDIVREELRRMARQ